MYILKLRKLGKLNLWKTAYDEKFPGGFVLSEFFEDFGDAQGIKLFREMKSDRAQQFMTGNISALDKSDNNKVIITGIYSTDPNYQLILDADVLLKVMELFNEAANTCPKEIIIKFDNNLQNPVVESVY
ncbi:MAG: hypothetical protein BWY54_00108 [Candidatus Dependentiae bacterium ADurb.Bin331]|nr:MAG: hypothetical protein BWY54_00108 [Candidatus Dependentiae bacterium ADurb.Bin331]